MGTEAETSGIRGYRWRPWKIALIVICGLFLAVGLITGALGGDEDEAVGASGDTPPVSVRVNNVGNSFGGSSGAGTDPSGFPTSTGDVAEPADPEIPWSPALFRGGISFFAAFVLAFAFRTFLRIALFFVGVWVASVFLLGELGWIEIHWEIIDDQFVALSGKVGEQFKSLSALVTGSLPSAGLAGLGLVTGFKKG